MARREINVFGASFLDLLAGALGAVLILYIIVPKLEITVEEFEEQQKLSEEIDKMGLTIAEISEMIPAEDLEAIQQQLQQIEDAKNQLQQQVQQTQQQLSQSQQQLSQSKQQVENLRPYKDWMDTCGFTPNDPCPVKAAADVDVGFSFQGKKIVFIIDVSGSMEEEDRIGQVKAGIKMLLSTMGSDYEIDILSYTNLIQNQGDPDNIIIDPLWRQLTMLNPLNRDKAYSFLNTLIPDGGTPTGTVLQYVFQNYSNATDIMLLTDGSPSDFSTDEIIADVARMNSKGIRVNCIGVGNDFVDNPTNPNVIFLKELANQNNGFFIGF